MEQLETYTPNIGAFVGVVVEHALLSPRKVTVSLLISHVDDTGHVVIHEFDVQDTIVCDGFWDGIGRYDAGAINVRMSGMKARFELHTRIDAFHLVKMDDGREILMTGWAFARKDNWLQFDVP